jgi:hypothetical protein
MEGRETRHEYTTPVGKGYTRTVALLFFGLFHYFIAFASGAQQLILGNFRLVCVYGWLLLRSARHDEKEREGGNYALLLVGCYTCR